MRRRPVAALGREREQRARGEPRASSPLGPLRHLFPLGAGSRALVPRSLGLLSEMLTSKARSLLEDVGEQAQTEATRAGRGREGKLALAARRMLVERDVGASLSSSRLSRSMLVGEKVMYGVALFVYAPARLIAPQLARDLLDAPNALLHLDPVVVREGEAEVAGGGLGAALRRRRLARRRRDDVVRAGREQNLRRRRERESVAVDVEGVAQEREGRGRDSGEGRTEKGGGFGKEGSERGRTRLSASAFHISPMNAFSGSSC